MASFDRLYKANASADRESLRNEASTNKFNLLEDVAADAGAAALTVDVELGPKGAENVTVGWALTHDSATAVNVTAYISLDGGATYKQIASRSITGGVATNSDFSDTISVSDDDAGVFMYEPGAATHFRAVLSATDGVTADTLSMQIGIRR